MHAFPNVHEHEIRTQIDFMMKTMAMELWSSSMRTKVTYWKPFFIPFTDLEDPEKMKEHYSTIKALLDKYGISLKDFHDALEALELYCENIARLLNKFRWVGAGAILIIPLLPPLIMMAGEGLGALGTGGSFGPDIWGDGVSILNNRETDQHLLDRDNEQPGFRHDLHYHTIR